MIKRGVNILLGYRNDLYTFLFVYISVCLHFCMFTFRIVYISDCLHLCLFTFPFVYISVCLHFCLFTFRFVYISVCLHLRRLTCLYNSPPVGPEVLLAGVQQGDQRALLLRRREGCTQSKLDALRTAGVHKRTTGTDTQQ